MAATSTNNRRIAGIVLAALGVGVILWAWQDAQSLGNEITRAVSGSPNDDVVYRYIGGAAALVAGLYLLLVRR